MHTDKAIAEFEAWWDRQPHSEQFADVKDQMRNVWMASRREVVVELPSDRSLSASDDPWSVRDWCQHAIERTGVRTKT